MSVLSVTGIPPSTRSSSYMLTLCRRLLNNVTSRQLDEEVVLEQPGIQGFYQLRAHQEPLLLVPPHH